MPSFEYIALTAKGERVVGELAGVSEQAVLAELETRALTPVSLSEQQEGARGGAGGLSRLRGGWFGGRIASTRQLATSYAQLADLLRAGVPLLRALRLLGGQKARRGLRLAKVWAEVAEAVASGSDLAEAMSAANSDGRVVFSPIHIAMVRAGEKGGFLEQVLERLGKFLGAQADMRSKVIGSLIYPSILVVVGALVMGAIFGFFIPMFRGFLEKAPLGPLTRAVLGLSTIVREYGLVLLVLLVIAATAVWRASKRPDVREKIAVWLVRSPVVGPLLKAMAVARFCRILGTMLANSIPMLASMQIARDAAGNPLLERAIDEATEAVRQGQPMAPPLAAAGGGGKAGLFPEDVIEMISVGEQANNLDAVLVTIAETVEGRVDRMLSAAVKLIEPLMLMLLAAVIATVAMALLLPITRMGMGQRLGQ